MEKITELDGANTDCAICDGEGWVCENHPEIKWGDGDNCCGGAGSPCTCNPLHPLSGSHHETA